MKNYLLSVSTLSGTIIGAGIFSLPFVFKTLGIGTSAIYLLLFALVFTFVHYMYAQVLVKNKGTHQFVYLAEKYLPKGFSKISSFVMFSELVLVLVVYLVLAPKFMNVAFGLSETTAIVIFWLLGSILMFVPRGITGILESLDTLMILLIVGLIIGTSALAPDAVSASVPVFGKLSWLTLLIPFGPLLFSISGRPGISEVVKNYEDDKKKANLFLSILLGTFAPVVLYLIFVVVVLSVSPDVGESALESLIFLPSWLYKLLGAMGCVTLITSYFVIARNVKNVLSADLKWKLWSAASVAIFLPLALKLVAFDDFITAVSFVGGTFLALESIFVIWIWQRANPKYTWRLAASFLYLIFLAALIYEIINLLHS